MATCPAAARQFQSWTVPELRQFLITRGVPVGVSLKDELVQNCYAAEQLDLQRKPPITEQLEDIADAKAQKLVLNEGVIRLPDPDGIQFGWEDSPHSFPDVEQSRVESYFDKSQ
ncbi:uncharacterized protein [Ptychodera flava]|uniref:uncharacterized protein isoform X2 n=1 Tax=Ptychodera flava TaxID=63121 RepID=UPI00396A610D